MEIVNVRDCSNDSIECVVFATSSNASGRTSAEIRWVRAPGIERPARLKLDRLEAARVPYDLLTLPGNRFEALKGDRTGRDGIRINDPMMSRLSIITEGTHHGIEGTPLIHRGAQRHHERPDLRRRSQSMPHGADV